MQEGTGTDSSTTTEEKGYTLFTKQYFIGIIVGVVGLMAYQKYIKK
tara:strand:- start:1139 stop:1276 length:138 start_codon:yes stop_codon:yes gene_type:complete